MRPIRDRRDNGSPEIARWAGCLVGNACVVPVPLQEASTGADTFRGMLRHGKALRAAAAVAVSGLCVVYIVTKIDLRETALVLAHSTLWLAGLALAVLVLVLVPLSWRWQRLLEAR